MPQRRSVWLPVTLGVVMIVLLAALTVGWVLLAVFGALSVTGTAALYWTLLSVGSAFFLFMIVGVVIYLSVTIKAINLTRRQSNFIDSVTHELKSPIASLKLYLQTLSRRNVDAEQQESFHRYMLDDVERLDTLINHLLDAGRIEHKAEEEEIESVELSALIQQCAETVCLRYRVPTEAVALDLQPCMLDARPVDLDVIFRNLIDNAVKYAGRPPEVQVSLKHTGDRAIALISDNGSGIPRRLRRKIFGRFVRLGSELVREKPGTGLGLYIVRTLVGRLGGKIRVRDRDEGSGTVFELQLPGASAPKTAPQPKPVSEPIGQLG